MRESDFGWTFDQYQRYGLLASALEVFFPGKKVSLLDVGGFSPTAEAGSYWFPAASIEQAKAIILDRFPVSASNYLQGDGQHLPFKKKSFDAVAALDVLEHVPVEQRASFIKEICRVAQNLVVLSAPFASPEIERAERALQEQIKSMYGATHAQLDEHEKFGLPESEMVRQEFKKNGWAAQCLYFGSVTNWLIFQSFRHLFLGRKLSGQLQKILDRWLVSLNPESEGQAPFYRGYWIACPEENEAVLEEKTRAVAQRWKEKLAEKARMNFELSQELNRLIIDYFQKDFISAVVISSNPKPQLKRCLEHLLTQEVGLDLEVAVCWPEKNLATEAELKKSFPGIKFYSFPSGIEIGQGFFELALKLRGTHWLFLHDRILLPPFSVQRLYESLKSREIASIISPGVIWKRFISPVWRGGNPRWLKKLLAGRLPWPLSPRKEKSPPEDQKLSSWIYSECLLVEKKALLKRKLAGKRFFSRYLFLWETQEPLILYDPTITVYKVS